MLQACFKYAGLAGIAEANSDSEPTPQQAMISAKLLFFGWRKFHTVGDNTAT
jgi:hypothetical protein